MPDSSHERHSLLTSSQRLSMVESFGLGCVGAVEVGCETACDANKLHQNRGMFASNDVSYLFGTFSRVLEKEIQDIPSFGAAGVSALSIFGVVGELHGRMQSD
jgi:hypothetical protein